MPRLLMIALFALALILPSFATAGTPTDVEALGGTVSQVQQDDEDDKDDEDEDDEDDEDGEEI